MSDYAAEKLWQPLGAEADATWIIDATGQETTFAYVNAVLRDWARLGLRRSFSGRFDFGFWPIVLKKSKIPYRKNLRKRETRANFGRQCLLGASSKIGE